MKVFRHKIASILLLLVFAIGFSSCEKNELWDLPGDDQILKSSGGDGDGHGEDDDITDDEDDDEDDENRESVTANK